MNIKNKFIILCAISTTLTSTINWRADALEHKSNDDIKDFVSSFGIKVDNGTYPIVHFDEREQNNSDKKEYIHKFIDWGVCYSGYTKSNMDLDAITNTQSKQYKLKQSYWLDEYGHYRYSFNDIDYYVVALGSYYGEIGDKFRITLSNGNIFYVIKGDEKSDTQTVNGCYHPDGSVIEFIVDTNTVYSAYENFHGGFQVYDKWNGDIIKVEKEV